MPRFLAEAIRAKLEINPVSGEEIERTVANLFKLDPAMIAKLRTVLLSNPHGHRRRAEASRRSRYGQRAATLLSGL